MKQFRAWLAVLSLAVWGCGNAVSMEYTGGMVNTGTVVVGSGQSVTLHIKSPGEDSATQSGAISSDTDSATLTITADTGLPSPTLRLTGDNTAYTGTVNFQRGILEVGAAENLFGRMANFNFGGSSSGIPGLESTVDAMKAAVNAYAATPNYTTRQAMDDAKAAHAAAVTAAEQSGMLPTLAIADGQSVTWAGDGGTDQRLSFNGAGAIHLGIGAGLTFIGHDNGGNDGGAIDLGYLRSSLSLTGGSDGSGFVFKRNTAWNGGAISSYGTLTVSNAVFTENSADNVGGALENSGKIMALSDVVFSENTAGSGGALYNSATLMVSNADFIGNTARDTSGGAIKNSLGTLEVSDSVFTGNTANSSGGAINNTNSTLTVSDSAFTGNSANLVGGAIHIFNDNTEVLKTTIAATANATTLFSGNMDAVGADSIHLELDGDSVTTTLLVDAATGSVVDIRDPMGGILRASASNSTNAIEKTGVGVWKLGGDNHFTNAGTGNKTTFTVEDGTLYLYREGEVANGQNGDVEAGVLGIAGPQSSFTLRNGATLAVGGGSVGNGIYISYDGTSGGTRHGVLTIERGSTLAFDLGHAVSGQAMLELVADTFTIKDGSVPGSFIAIDLLSLSKTDVTDQVLVRKNNSVGTDITGNVASNVTLRGENIASSRAAALNISVSTGVDTVKLSQKAGLASQVSTWHGGDGNWNITDTGWSGTAPENQFLHGDIVNFSTGGTNTLALNPSGDGTVLVAGMYVSGGDADTVHAFTGNGITADATGGTSFDTADPAANNAASGKLVLGANASKLADNHASFTTQVFKGVVDLTGTTSNSFRNGVDLYSGELRISSVNQLGLDGSLKTSAGGTINFMAEESSVSSSFDDKVGDGTVTIADVDAERANGTLGVLRITGDVSLDGIGGDAGRLVVDFYKAGAIHVGANAGLAFRNNVSSANGGALSIGAGGLFAMTADGGGNGYEFTGNTTTNSGGALYNEGALSLSDAIFTKNTASSGGAIYNASIMTISNGVFTENSATGDGGAIASSSTQLVITDTVFTGNNAAVNGGAISSSSPIFTISSSATGLTRFSGNQAGGRANSLHISPSSGAAVVTINAEGLIDMRDPMTAEAAAAKIFIKKTGTGVWMLGGNTMASVIDGIQFNINEGTLYLYRKDEVENSSEQLNDGMVETGTIDIAGTNDVFSLAAGATLSLGGVGHRIAVSAGTIDLADGSTLAFDMTAASGGSTSLTLDATTFGGADIGSGTIRVTNFTIPTAVGETYTLVDAGSANATANTGALHINGSAVPHQVGRSAFEYGLAVDATRQRLLLKAVDASQNTSLTWRNAGLTGAWNASDRNWSGDIDGVRVDQFLTGDSVVFGANLTPVSIAVASAGVDAGDMTVAGAYNFTGGAIRADDVTVAATGAIGLVAGDYAALTADSVDFSTTGSLNISGYAPGTANPFDNPVSVQTVVATAGGVRNFNSAVTVAGQSTVDFLAARAVADGNDILVETGLRWYSTDTTRPAHGTFTIQDGQTFTLGAVLADNSLSTNKAPTWNGNSLTKLGDGTLVLTAANTFTGATAIDAGVLRLNHAGALSGSAVSVAADATLGASQSANVASLAFADGAVLSIGTGTTVAATGTVTFGGDLTVDLSNYASGVYTILSGANVSGFDPDRFTTTLGGFAPAADRASIAYYQGTDGSRDVVNMDISIINQSVTWKGGSGNWAEAHWNGSSDNRFYNGDAVTFDAGSGTVAVNAAGIQVADMVVSGSAYVFSGGDIASTTNPTLAGATERLTVAAGSATFQNNIDFANGIAVGDGGELYGSADMRGGVSIASGGTFGAVAGGTLTVDSLTLESGATFAVADNASLVDVSGGADITGDIRFAFGSGFAPGDVRTILSASGITGWSGQTEIESGFLRYIVDAINGDTALQVTVEQYRSLVELGLTPNQAAVVSGLEKWNGGDNDIHKAVLALTDDDEARYALSVLNGQVHANLPSSIRRFSHGYWQLLAGPVLSLRGSAGDEASRSVTDGGAAFASLNPRYGLARRPFFWFSGGALSSRSRGDRDTARDRLTGSDFKVGGETSLCDWNLGLAFRYGDTKMKVRDRASQTDIDNYQLGLYALRQVRFGPGLFRLTLGASGGYHDIESRRHVAFGSINQHLRADYHAWSLNGLVEAAYRLDASSRLAVEPYLSLGWDSVWTQFFTESGGSAALHADRDHQGNFSTTLGTRLSYRLSDRVSVDGRAGWRHTFGSVRPQSAMAFAGSPTRDSFTAIGSRLASDEFVGGVGASVDLNSRVTVRVDYAVEAGNGGFGHRGTVSVGVGF